MLIPLVVVGPKGTNKSGAFNFVMDGVKNLEVSDIEQVMRGYISPRLRLKNADVIIERYLIFL